MVTFLNPPHWSIPEVARETLQPSPLEKYHDESLTFDLQHILRAKEGNISTFYNFSTSFHTRRDSQVYHMRITPTTVPPLKETDQTLPLVNFRKCKPISRIVFLKTHKTASTTTASIFERYGYYRNLTFAIGRTHILSYTYKFSHLNLMKFPGMEGKPFDILCNHARYNRKEMDLVVPDATYVTILRRPEKQIDSAFGYFEMYRGMKLGMETNPLKAFMKEPRKYYKEHKYHMWQESRNGMLFDLGFDHKYDDDEAKILQKINELDAEFDLVMIAEYFDESLLLLKKLLCWEFEDILYLSSGVRSSSHRYELDEDLIKRLREWSHGDSLLYNHFNTTFWKKVADYGPTFEADLKHFRQLNRAVFQDCIAENQMNKKDRREDKFMLKNKSERCAAILRADVPYTGLIRKSMVARFSPKPSSVT